MRILILQNIITPHIVPVFEALARRPGVELTVAYFAELEGERRWATPAGQHFEQHILPGRQVNIFGKSNTLSFHFNPTTWSFMTHRPFDVCMNSGWASMTNWMAFAACKRLGRPHVMWAGSTVAEKSIQRTISLPLVKLLVGKSDAWLGYGTASCEYMNSLGADPARNVPSFHCVDNDAFLTRLEAAREKSATIRGHFPGKKLILFVGRLVGVKGVEYLVNAMAAIRARIPEAHLLLCGDGALRKELEAHAHKIAPDAVSFVGHVALEELPAYYGAADLFVLPSLEEPWGLVINEAALAALPIISTSICGASPDLVTRENGRVIPPADARAIADAAIEILANDPKKMGAAARELVLAKSNPAGVAEAMHRACEIAVQSRG